VVPSPNVAPPAQLEDVAAVTAPDETLDITVEPRLG
jgi:hypothetical protein